MLPTNLHSRTGGDVSVGTLLYYQTSYSISKKKKVVVRIILFEFVMKIKLLLRYANRCDVGDVRPRLFLNIRYCIQ